MRESKPSPEDINTASFAIAGLTLKHFPVGPSRRIVAETAVYAICDPARGRDRFVRLGDVLDALDTDEVEEPQLAGMAKAGDLIKAEFLGKDG